MKRDRLCVICILVQEKGYTRSQGGLFHALRRLGLIEKPKKKGRRNYRQCTQCERGRLRRDEKSLYQWTAIDECTRARYLHIYEEHTPENAVKFLEEFLKWFPFEVNAYRRITEQNLHTNSSVMKSN